LRELPEVEHADVATVVPLTGVSSMEAFRELGSTEKPRNINSNAVGDDYFVTMGIPLLHGRQFSQVKGEGEVAIINAAFAKIFWPNRNPIGRQIVSPDDPAKSIQIVGMVGTGKYDSVTEGPTPILYRPLDQQFSSTLIFHVRTRVQPDNVLPRIVKTVQSYDINMPVFDAKTMEDALVLSVAPYKVLGVTFSIFGGFATVLAFSGLYSLITFQASRRKREIGIRVALGATPRSILQLLAKQGMRLVIIGVILGVPASIGLAMLIGSFLFGVAPIDPITYVLILGMLAAATGIAIAIPAMGAMKVQPMDALRAP
jgi:ABC-type antimicrobial peptide transport system permease subunit